MHPNPETFRILKTWARAWISRTGSQTCGRTNSAYDSRAVPLPPRPSWMRHTPWNACHTVAFQSVAEHMQQHACAARSSAEVRLCALCFVLCALCKAMYMAIRVAKTYTLDPDRWRSGQGTWKFALHQAEGDVARRRWQQRVGPCTLTLSRSQAHEMRWGT